MEEKRLFAEVNVARPSLRGGRGDGSHSFCYKNFLTTSICSGEDELTSVFVHPFILETASLSIDAAPQQPQTHSEASLCVCVCVSSLKCHATRNREASCALFFVFFFYFLCHVTKEQNIFPQSWKRSDGMQ